MFNVLLARIFLIIIIISPLQASFIKTVGDISYYSFSQGEDFPSAFADQAKSMLLSAYDPILHEGMTLEEMGLKNVETYEEFLDKLLADDFDLYHKVPESRVIFYACTGSCLDNYNNLVGICSLLPQKESGHYFIDHIGARNTYQRQGIGGGLLQIVTDEVSDLHLLTLDTRVFNSISKPFYEKHGFQLIIPHPIIHKVGKYLRYEKRFDK